MMTLRSLVVTVLLTAIATSVRAEEIVVSNYATSANGMPFGVALAKGYFKDEGAQHHGDSFHRQAAARHCATCWPAEACLMAK